MRTASSTWRKLALAVSPNFPKNIRVGRIDHKIVFGTAFCTEVIFYADIYHTYMSIAALTIVPASSSTSKEFSLSLVRPDLNVSVRAFDKFEQLA